MLNFFQELHNYNTQHLQHCLLQALNATFTPLTYTSKQVLYLDETTSTNTLAKHLLKQTSQNYLIIAKQQTAGRGTHARSWYSQPNNSLLLTYVMPIDNIVIGMSMAVGLAVHEFLMRIYPNLAQQLFVKWPNDIYLNTAKMGGILLETYIDANKQCYLIIGIGLNLLRPKPNAIQTIDDKALPEKQSPIAYLNDLSDLIDLNHINDTFLQSTHALQKNKADIAWCAYIAALINHVQKKIMLLQQQPNNLPVIISDFKQAMQTQTACLFSYQGHKIWAILIELNEQALALVECTQDYTPLNLKKGMQVWCT